MGKTRLVSELSGAREGRQGARTLCGECVELGEGELPYAPLVAALRPLVARRGPRARRGRRGRARRAGHAAARARRRRQRRAPRPDEGAGAAQRRLFEALLALLERLGREQPVLLLLEDIHWADSSTRSFLAFVARAMSTERVLAVCTYRSDELHRRHPLRPLLAELERDPSARRIELARLSRAELAEQLADILDGAPEPALVERLYGRSEGNPLFAEELLAAGGDGRGALPPTLRDALMVRTERLPEAAQEVLRVLAVAQRADHALLADAGGLDAAELRTALREAAAGHLIVASADGMYRFRHALLREVVHDDLLPGEHAELHLALARALERRAAAGAEDVWITAGMAHHFRSAGDQPAALKASVQAAAASARVHAHGEAAGLLERALEIWDRVPDAEALAGASPTSLAPAPPPLTPPPAARCAASSSAATGDLDAARAVVEEAIDRIEFCSEDGERLAEVACVGVRVEADAAERARDLGDEEAERGARMRAEMMDARVQAAAEDLDLPVTAAHAACVRRRRRARRGRARPGALRRRGGGLERRSSGPYPAAHRPLRRGRGAPARPATARPRSPPPARPPTAPGRSARAGSPTRSRASPPAPACGSTTPPPRRRPTATAEEEAAFGLTPRELQVLALLAGGATNREIGAQLFMAEKTASVHVSRILSKLDVRSRTEAAAVAHRHGLEAAADPR